MDNYTGGNLPTPEEFVDLKAVPRFRRIGRNRLIERMRLAVPFDHIAVLGLDIDGYGLETMASVVSTLPPAFLDAYVADELVRQDPLIRAAMAGSPVDDARVLVSQAPPQRLLYLLDFFDIRNRTVFPVAEANWFTARCA